MNLQDMIKQDYILTDMGGNTRNSVLQELLDAAEQTGNVTDRALLFQDLLEREAAFTTKLMDKVAIPHAKSAAVKEPMVFIGKSREGVSWTADGSEEAAADRVYLLFLILVPQESDSNDHLKLLAILARCLSHESLRTMLLETEEKDVILNILGEKMQEINNR